MSDSFHYLKQTMSPENELVSQSPVKVSIPVKIKIWDECFKVREAGNKPEGKNFHFGFRIWGYEIYKSLWEKIKFGGNWEKKNKRRARNPKTKF